MIEDLCGHDGAGFQVVEERPLAGDASTRRYSRVTARDGLTAIVVRYPEAAGKSFRRDMEVLDWCERRGLRVPRRYGVSERTGSCCFEDWGEDDAEAVLRRCDPGERRGLATRLVEPLRRLAGIGLRELPPWNPPLGLARLRQELAGCERWFLGELLGWEPGPEVGRWFDELARVVSEHPLRICHRDYHLNNLFFLRDGSVGLLDIQDILVGPDTYDAASLVGDRAFPELFDGTQREEWLGQWASGTAAEPGWERRVRETEAQRGFKVLGTFARLVASGRPAYGAWLGPLAGRMAALGGDLGAPRRLVSLLLDWAVDGERRSRR